MATRNSKKKIAAVKLKAPADGLDTEQRRAVEDLKKSVKIAQEVLNSTDAMVVLAVFDRVFSVVDEDMDDEY